MIAPKIHLCFKPQYYFIVMKYPVKKLYIKLMLQ